MQRLHGRFGTHEPLEAGDVLVIAGASDAVESARRLVTTGETDAVEA